MKVLLSTFVLGLVSINVFAHEGHDHGSLSAPHGGAVFEGKKFAVELVQEGSKVKLYPVNSQWKVISISDVGMTAQVEFPKKKPEPLSLKKEDSFYSAAVDAKGAYRYKMIVDLTVKTEKEQISFQVEPQ